MVMNGQNRQLDRHTQRVQLTDRFPVPLTAKISVLFLAMDFKFRITAKISALFLAMDFKFRITAKISTLFRAMDFKFRLMAKISTNSHVEHCETP